MDAFGDGDFFETPPHVVVVVAVAVVVVGI